MKTFVIGHSKPDTDSVVSAMAMAFLTQNCPNDKYENPIAVMAGDLNPETSYLFEKFAVEKPAIITAADIQAKDKVILVDHNEESQRLEGLNNDQIIEIVDHHKMNINFSNPIDIMVKTWGCSCSIIYHRMRIQNITPDKTLASLMLAAILSDTVAFKSSTCTPKDKEMAMELAKIAEITDIDAFALEIFKAKSNVSKLSCEEIVKNDYKVFDFNGKKVLIDQVETVEQESIITEKKDCLLTAMKKVKQEEAVDLLFVVITDILKVNSKLLLLGNDEEATAIKAFGGNVTEQLLDIGPKLSRKKEIAPAIEQALN